MSKADSLNIHVRGRNKGFTLIELLVVISIIGILSTIAMTSLGGAKKKARDAVRRSHLNQISLALEQYQAQYGTYLIAGAGSGGGGEGWFNYEDASDNYAESIAHALENEGYYTKRPLDPLLTTSSQFPQYMVYATDDELCVYAHLESPSPEDIASYQDSKNAGCYDEAYYGIPLDSYGMNYAVGSY